VLIFDGKRGAEHLWYRLALAARRQRLAVGQCKLNAFSFKWRVCGSFAFKSWRQWFYVRL
jgi:hypothetical protein